MITTLIILLILLCLVWAHKEWSQARLKSTPKPTPDVIIKAVIRHCKEQGDEGVLLDLGAGYGHFVMAVGKALPDWTVMGVEASPVVWALAQIKLLYSNQRNVHIYFGDLGQDWPEDMYLPTVVFNSLPPSQVKRAAPNIQHYLKIERDGILHWLISPGLPLRGLEPAKREVIGKPDQEVTNETPKNRVLYFYNTEALPKEKRLSVDEIKRQQQEEAARQRAAAEEAGIAVGEDGALSPEDEYAMQEAAWRAAQEGAEGHGVGEEDETVAPSAPDSKSNEEPIKSTSQSNSEGTNSTEPEPGEDTSESGPYNPYHR